MKKRIKKTHPDILPSSHRKPYQLKYAIKSGGTVFCMYHLDSIVYQGALFLEQRFYKNKIYDKKY